MKREEMLERAVLEGKKIGPEMVMISPTDRCNLSCRTCWRMNKDDEDFEKGLSLEKITEILDDCDELGVKKIDFTGGGEPFTRSIIFDMIEEAKKRDFEVGLTTNGTLLNEEKIKRLIDLGLDEILFSLDGDKETNDFLRGDGVFEAVIENTKLYRNLSSEATVGFSSVISDENYDELISIVELAEDLELDYVNFTVMNVWESNKEFKLIKDDKDDIFRSLKETEDLLDRISVGSNIDKIIKYGIFERSPPKFCFAPWQMAFVNASGEVMACCTLASYYKNLLGNVKEKRFLNIWNGEELEEFREEMRQRKFQEKCRECLPVFIENYNKYYGAMDL